jgi:thiamine biosynthesis lipoprotein
MKTVPRIILLIVFLVLSFLVIFYLQGYFYSEKSTYMMGTPIRIKLAGANAPRLVERGMAEIRRLEDLLSKFNPQSEVSLINRLAGVTSVKVSGDTLACIKIGREISSLSDGAFDITLGNSKDLVVDVEKREVFVKRAGVEIDLGGVGKGYAAEAAVGLLLKNGAKNGMIDMRSSIAVFGRKTWKIGIQHPRRKDQLLGKIILKGGQSLSTSGDYERGRHIIDPRSGLPAKLCQGVTVIGKNMAETDALSTAVFVLGPGEGMRLIESLPHIEGLIVDAEGKMYESSGFVLVK